MNADTAKPVLVVDGQGHIEEATLDGEAGLVDEVGEVVAGFPSDDGKAG